MTDSHDPTFPHELLSASISHGTMRPQDVLPRMLSAVRAVAPWEYVALLLSPFGPIPAYAQEDDYSEWWESDEAANLHDTMLGILEDAAPEGYYFGAHPGDGADFGFWRDPDSITEPENGEAQQMFNVCTDPMMNESVMGETTMRVQLITDKTLRYGGYTLYRLYWPDEDREGGWATSLDLFPEGSTARVFTDAKLIGGKFLGGEFWGGVFRDGEFWDGKFLGGAFLGGSFLGGEFWSGSFWGGSFLGGEFLGGEFFGGSFRDGEFRGGVFRDGVFHCSPAMAQRSDGYCFVVHPVKNKLRVWAGCRNFSWKEAVKHWGDDYHPHHEESMRILKFLRKQVKARMEKD